MPLTGFIGVSAGDLAPVVDAERDRGHRAGDVEPGEATAVPYEAVTRVGGEPIGRSSCVGVAADDLAAVVDGKRIVDLLGTGNIDDGDRAVGLTKKAQTPAVGVRSLTDELAAIVDIGDRRRRRRGTAGRSW